MTHQQNNNVKEERTISSSPRGQMKDQDQDQEPKDIIEYINYHFDLLQWRLNEEKKMMEANKYLDEQEQVEDMEEDREENGATAMEEDEDEDIMRNPQDHEDWDDAIEESSEVTEIIKDEDRIWQNRALWQVHDDTED